MITLILEELDNEVIVYCLLHIRQFYNWWVLVSLVLGCTKAEPLVGKCLEFVDRRANVKLRESFR